MIPLTTARDLAVLAERMGQATDTVAGNLGLGYVYYGLARLLQPTCVVCIGSYRGFAPVTLARGLADNGKGRCHFIDPGLVDRFWHDARSVERLTRANGIAGRWTHLRKTSQQALAAGDIPSVIDLLMIDGDHSFSAVQFDFEHFGRRVRPGGFILLHDSIVEGKGFTRWEVKRFVATVVSRRTEFERLTLPFGAGLTVLRKLR